MAFKLNTDLINTEAVVEEASSQIADVASDAVSTVVQPIVIPETVINFINIDQGQNPVLKWFKGDNNETYNVRSTDTQIKPNAGFKIWLADTSNITFTFNGDPTNFTITANGETVDGHQNQIIIQGDQYLTLKAKNGSAYIKGVTINNRTASINEVLFNNVAPIGKDGLRVNGKFSSCSDIEFNIDTNSKGYTPILTLNSHTYLTHSSSSLILNTEENLDIYSESNINANCGGVKFYTNWTGSNDSATFTQTVGSIKLEANNDHLHGEYSDSTSLIVGGESISIHADGTMNYAEPGQRDYSYNRDLLDLDKLCGYRDIILKLTYEYSDSADSSDATATLLFKTKGLYTPINSLSSFVSAYNAGKLELISGLYVNNDDPNEGQSTFDAGTVVGILPYPLVENTSVDVLTYLEGHNETTSSRLYKNCYAHSMYLGTNSSGYDSYDYEIIDALNHEHRS